MWFSATFCELVRVGVGGELMGRVSTGSVQYGL